MKKLSTLLCIIPFLLHCGPRQDIVERIMEDGIEVVLNHLEPYTVEGASSSLTLIEEISIDTGDDSVAELGLTDIWAINVDGSGNIYLWNSPRSKENLVHKFDPNGNFLKSFLKRGQGPDEVQSPNLPIITVKNDFVVTDYFPKKLLYLSFDGEIKQEVSLETRALIVYPLENGNFFVNETRQEPSGAYSDDIMNLYNSEMKEIKQLLFYREEDFRTASKMKATMIDRPYILWAISANRIFVGDNDQSVYEVDVYDHDGNIVRKIRKEFMPVGVSDEYKKNILGPLEKSPNATVRDVAKRIFFPKYMPPYQSLFCDDQGHIFVMTFEVDEASKSYICDVFNPEGIFISRVSFGNYAEWEKIIAGSLVIIAKNNKVYCRTRKDSGYVNLVVYKMTWQ